MKSRKEQREQVGANKTRQNIKKKGNMNCQKKNNHSVYAMKSKTKKQRVKTNHNNTTDSTSLKLKLKQALCKNQIQQK